MLYEVKNKADQPLVCSLADNTTLRLAINQSKKITHTQMTDHLKNLSSKGLLIIREVVDKKKPTKNNSAKTL